MMIFKSFFQGRKNAGILTLLMLALCGIATPALAFTSAEADTAFSAYIQKFYFTNEAGGYFHVTTDGGKSWFWERAEQMEMLLDTYERTKNPECLTLFSNVFRGFIAGDGATWEKNEFNDDILWMVIACARANQLTGNAAFRDTAKMNFDLCYARAWSTNLGGGWWWKTSNEYKNACVNGPAAIAAYLLYQICGDTNYLAKAMAAYDWERAHLFDPASGAIWDDMDKSGKINRKVFSYNLGTFIGAANFLGHTNDARLAADYFKSVLCREGLMPDYTQAGDLGGFNGIGARWLARFMKDRGLQASYLKWLQANGDAAWKMRRSTDNLAWSRWSVPTPEGVLYSWACSSTVVILQVTPPGDEPADNLKN